MQKGQENKTINGVIETDKGNIVFYAEDFKFTFMNPHFSGEDIVLKADKSGYIYGKTYSRKRIAIFSRKDINVKGICVLNTWNYIISKSDYAPKQLMQSFKGIRFKNGVIKTIYPCNGLHRDMEKSKGEYLVYRRERDCQEYDLKQGKKSVIWQFSSIIRQSHSLDEGIALSNSDSILDIIFEEEQEFSVFCEYYAYVCNLCSFLTFRSNISFSNILLFQELEISEGNLLRNEYAECYVKTPGPEAQRKMPDIIPIRYLNENIFKEIFNNLLKTDEKHNGLPVSIAPKDDRDVMMMDIGKIRTICSALEMELDLEGVRLPINDEMKKLIASIQQVVKDHRVGNAPLTEKAYSYICGNLSHWGQPLAERAWAAWEQHEAEMELFLNKYGISITKEDVQEFVRTRNNITHNGAMGISEEACIAAFALMGLIYCCTLTRLGMASGEIKNILGRRLIG